jgi:hypothetical protein
MRKSPRRNRTLTAAKRRRQWEADPRDEGHNEGAPRQRNGERGNAGCRRVGGAAGPNVHSFRY